jgi:hypothetical protein
MAVPTPNREHAQELPVRVGHGEVADAVGDHLPQRNPPVHLWADRHRTGIHDLAYGRLPAIDFTIRDPHHEVALREHANKRALLDDRPLEEGPVDAVSGMAVHHTHVATAGVRAAADGLQRVVASRAIEDLDEPEPGDRVRRLRGPGGKQGGCGQDDRDGKQGNGRALGRAPCRGNPGEYGTVPGDRTGCRRPVSAGGEWRRHPGVC